MTPAPLPPSPPLPEGLRTRPVAHRALHDRTAARPENSRAALRAAVVHGYGAEIDLQLSADGVPMVFHDDALDRLTAETGPLRDRNAAELGAIPLAGADGEGIPTLAEVLALVAGRIPLLIEIKDQDGLMGPDIGPLEAAVARDLDGYAGPVAVMSFNPHSVIAFARLSQGTPRGITTSGYRGMAGDPLPEARRAELREIPDLDEAGAGFISHEAADLGDSAVARVKARGLPVLCWTIRSPEQEAGARRHADNITFEGYLPPLAGA